MSPLCMRHKPRVSLGVLLCVGGRLVRRDVGRPLPQRITVSRRTETEERAYKMVHVRRVTIKDSSSGAAERQNATLLSAFRTTPHVEEKSRL